jgi:hypothetical protein
MSATHQGAGAFLANIRDVKQPKILKHNINTTTKCERDNIDQVLDDLQRFYDEEKKRLKDKEEEQEDKIKRQE